MLKNWKTILLLAIPSIASFASMTVTGTINLIMVGNLGALAIAIVGVSNIVMYNVWALCSGIGHTVNYLVAQSYGSGEMEKGVERTFIALLLGGAAGVLIILAGFFATEAIFKVLGSSSEMIAEGNGYLQIRFFAIVFSIFSFTIHGFFRGIGNTRTPMFASLLANAAMIFFTYSLTYGKLGFPELGLTGAAWALFIGEVIGLLFTAYAFIKTVKPSLKPVLRFIEAKFISIESFKLGMQEFSKSMAMFVFTAFVTRLGTHALAANEIALSIMSFGFMPAAAFGSTATILVGQEIGRRYPSTAKSMGTQTAIMGSLFILLLGTTEFIFAEPLARIYTNDPLVYQLTAKLIMISAFLQLFDGFFSFYSGGLRGIGDTTFLMRASLALAWGFFIPLTYLLVFVFNLSSYGAWIALYTYLSVFGLILMARYYRTNWNNITMTKAGSQVA
ncbi:MATE family efflux transporter [Neobacillus notoginsengisoli]|uniref:Probable multidrug resistance protein NorM n=1 Tax=Neobacillus notoginsengisoli TaxID=1578198 RepID=A0A417YX16_9BACI|nr:MATE family efflux transporter [Neobacillus notoginsengisoli]RHW42030.1 MATE family efflux transporter [Neobacillus notoginsengisoli]